MQTLWLQKKKKGGNTGMLDMDYSAHDMDR